MANYNKSFDDIYKNGWKNSPSPLTPIKPEALNQYNKFCKNVETYLESNPQDPIQYMYDCTDVDTKNFTYDQYLVYDGNKWIPKFVDVSATIPDNIRIDNLNVYKPDYINYKGNTLTDGIMTIKNSYCYMTFRINYSDSVYSPGWYKLLGNFPKPKGGLPIYNVAGYTNPYDVTIGTYEPKIVRITGNGDLEIYNPVSYRYYYMDFNYLIE